MPKTEKITAFLENSFKYLCDEPEAIIVEYVEKEHETIAMVYVPGRDVGRIVGKDGKTCSALRTICRNIGARDGNRIYLKVESLNNKV